ncbi:MAG TPA: MBOAT family O-acyltransferase [Candidatus Omnitrophota bacterium]|nr:MBOAT family O-acyltransferase [Candidatus Omnitrophota bacterium]
MLFNSFEFVIFFIVVYSLYRILPHKAQNLMLLAASYFFYGFWDWRFLGLIGYSTLIDYVCGLKIGSGKTPKKRKGFLWLSIGSHLLILGFFKYFNFFAENLRVFADLFGIHLDSPTLHIILPVGISFYTFQAMGYTIDVYRGKMQPARNPIDFALYIAFFPQLVAGPIERASALLPQISNKRVITETQIDEGCWLIFWGFFKKVFIADNLAQIVNAVFSKTGLFSGSETLMGLYAFAFQIYGDFAGYSDIARGTAKLMGIELMVNFKFPYFVTDPREFWKNWHISLSTWLRDYLYIPLGGNRSGRIQTCRNIFLTMLLGGLWHGASWTFVLWGAYHGVLLIIHRAAEWFFPKQKTANSVRDGIKNGFGVFLMFHLTCFGWLLFRSKDFAQIADLLKNLLFNFRPFGSDTGDYGLMILFYIWPLLLIEFFEKKKDDLMIIFKWPAPVRWAFFILLFYLIAFWGEFGARGFIYFQF